MNQIKLFIELTRLKKPIGFMLLFWPCAWGLTLAYDFSSDLNNYFFYLILFFLGSVLMRSAGCIVNDILDNIKYSNSKFIYFSSCDVYGSTGRVIANEESPLKFDINSSRSNYAISKVMGERLCEYHRKKFGTKSIILRPGHTFGVGQSIKNDKRVILELIKKAIIYRRIDLIDDGSSVKTWGYISDIVCMILLISQKGKYQLYNTTGNDYLSIKKIAYIISKIIRNTSVTLKKTKKDDPDIVKVSSKKFLYEFGKYNSTNFSNGIKKLINSNKI